MSNMNISRARSGDLTNVETAFSVTPQNTQGATGQKFTEITFPDWQTLYGAYLQLPELKRTIDTHANWTLGKGYITDDSEAKVILDNIKGYGKETFNKILKNLIRNCLILGDAFAEIIRDPETKTLTNLKVLDPSTIKIMVDEHGIIDHYIQTSKLPEGKREQRFELKEIFHLSTGRVADNIRGTGVISAILWTVEAANEAMRDTRTFMHRYVKPMMKFMLDTDNQAKIDEFVAKMDRIVAKGENLYIPKDTVEHEVISVPVAGLVPIDWLRTLHGRIYQGVGVPELIMGSSSGTEGNSKVVYVTYQQTVENFQLEIEEEVWNQLYYHIELNFPATIQNELISDYNKDGSALTGFQPNDLTAGSGK